MFVASNTKVHFVHEDKKNTPGYGTVCALHAGRTSCSLLALVFQPMEGASAINFPCRASRMFENFLRF